jgi:hypothetical protein
VFQVAPPEFMHWNENINDDSFYANPPFRSFAMFLWFCSSIVQEKGRRSVTHDNDHA